MPGDGFKQRGVTSRNRCAMLGYPHQPFARACILAVMTADPMTVQQITDRVWLLREKHGWEPYALALSTVEGHLHRLNSRGLVERSPRGRLRTFWKTEAISR